MKQEHPGSGGLSLVYKRMNRIWYFSVWGKLELATF
ncbi:hypothetical protein J2Y02_003112 [Neobacillus drentensis]|nr:hypothetical protein [Neobacillus drentensis]